MVCTRGPGDYFVIRPSKLSLREIPRPEWNLDGRKYHLQPVGMVVDERTKHYAVIVKSRVRSTWQGVNLHQFKSMTGVWSRCGKDWRDNFFRELIGFCVHRDSLLVLLWRKGYDQLYRHSGACSWELVPGNVPDSPGMRPLFFDHRGNLYLAMPHSSGCFLWEYRDDSSDWTLINLVPNAGFYGLDADREYLYVGVYIDTLAIDFAVVAGDFLYFGKLGYFDYPCQMRETFVWRRMKYNLISRALETMPLDEVERMVLTP